MNDKFHSVNKTTRNKRNSQSVLSAWFVAFGPVSVALYVDVFLFLSFRIRVRSPVLLSSPESPSGGSVGKIRIMHEAPVKVR